MYCLINILVFFLQREKCDIITHRDFHKTNSIPEIWGIGFHLSALNSHDQNRN